LILDHALRLAAEGGLRAASIGALAAATGMTKSGVFLHFGSKPALDEAVIHTAVARFDRAVSRRAAAAPPGVARLAALS
jgi:AcrR family transcriptional regulator